MESKFGRGLPVPTSSVVLIPLPSKSTISQRHKQTLILVVETDISDNSTTARDHAFGRGRQKIRQIQRGLLWWDHVRHILDTGTKDKGVVRLDNTRNP